MLGLYSQHIMEGVCPHPPSHSTSQQAWEDPRRARGMLEGYIRLSASNDCF